MKAFIRGTLGRSVVILGLAAALGGCAIAPLPVRTEVTSFDSWSTLPADKSYVFVRTLEYQNSLEMDGYEALVRDELAIHGFKPAAAPDRAQLTVTLRPAVFGAQVRVRDWTTDPFYRPWYGYGRGFYCYGRGWYDPFWGFNNFGYETLDIYRRRLEIDIDSRSVAGKRFYEGRVENTGDSDALPAVMPFLIRALFTDFPGNSGQTRRIDVPVVERKPG